MNQTAVEFLYEALWEAGKDKFIWQIILQQAKKMEKEQIIEAHLNGQSEWDIKSLGDTQKKLSKQYYNETYK
jgi:hypothetical protein